MYLFLNVQCLGCVWTHTVVHLKMLWSSVLWMFISVDSHYKSPMGNHPFFWEHFKTATCSCHICSTFKSVTEKFQFQFMSFIWQIRHWILPLNCNFIEHELHQDKSFPSWGRTPVLCNICSTKWAVFNLWQYLFKIYGPHPSAFPSSWYVCIGREKERERNSS